MSSQQPDGMWVRSDVVMALEAEVATLRQERDSAMRANDAMTNATRVGIDAIQSLRAEKDAAEAENARLETTLRQANIRIDTLEAENARLRAGIIEKQGKWRTTEYWMDAEQCATDLDPLLAPPAETNHE